MKHCPILGFEHPIDDEKLFKFLAEPVMFGAFATYKSNYDHAHRRQAPRGYDVRKAAEEELLKPTPKYSKVPVIKTNWTQLDHRVYYTISVVKYARQEGGIWEDKTDNAIEAMVHAVFALLVFMWSNYRRSSRSYRAIEKLYEAESPDLNNEVTKAKVGGDADDAGDEDDPSSRDANDDDDESAQRKGSARRSSMP